MSINSRVALLRQLLKDSSKLCRSLYPDQLKVDFKEDGQPVTNVDLEINALIKSQQMHYFPEDCWYSEEEPFCPKEAVYSWIIDPIDGTSNMVNRCSEFVVSIALMQKGKLKAAGVINPITNESWFGTKGSITQLDGKPIHMDTVEDYILISKNATSVNHPKTKKMGSIAYRICKVVSGAGIAAISLRTIHTWDVAAAVFIAQECGYQVSDRYGKELTLAHLEDAVYGIIVARKDKYHEILKEIGQRRI